MPAKDLKPVMVYLPPKVADHYQAIADKTADSLSAVCRRELIGNMKKR